MGEFSPITVIVSTTYFRAPHKHTFLLFPVIAVAGCRTGIASAADPERRVVLLNSHRGFAGWADEGLGIG